MIDERLVLKQGMLLAIICALHGTMAWVFEHSRRSTSGEPVSPTLIVTGFVRPKIEEHPLKLTPDLSRIVVRTDFPLTELHLAHPEVDFSVPRNGNALIAAPVLQPDQGSGMDQYIREAALLPGEGATVVLRVEVLESGQPGRIEVDGSSGSRQIDRAVVEYARTRRWYAARVGGAPRVTWIRWGVHFQAPSKSALSGSHL
ncbi:MAG: TonB family protein [Steroidobacteraceae bacterium]